MTEEDLGKVFLFAVPWDWSFVGRFLGFSGDRLLIGEAGYFTRTGATFDKLCAEGFVTETQFHLCGEIKIPNLGPVFPWKAKWPQRKK